MGENRPPFGLVMIWGPRHLALKRQAGQSPPSGRSPALYAGGFFLFAPSPSALSLARAFAILPINAYGIG